MALLYILHKVNQVRNNVGRSSSSSSRLLSTGIVDYATKKFQSRGGVASRSNPGKGQPQWQLTSR